MRAGQKSGSRYIYPSSLTGPKKKTGMQNFCMPVFQKCRGEKTRTSDLHVPNVARCQLCYTPSGAFCDCKVNRFFYIAKFFRLLIAVNIIISLLFHLISDQISSLTSQFSDISVIKWRKNTIFAS